MKLMYSPGACSIGIHVLLEEIGKPYEAQLVNLREGGQFKPEFTSVNPKSKVPTLVRDDGSVLTEYPAIAYWLARTNPDKKLLPDDADAQARVLEALDYAVSTVHMQGFSRLFRAANYTPNPADEDKVKERGKELVEKGVTFLSEPEAALRGRGDAARPLRQHDQPGAAPRRRPGLGGVLVTRFALAQRPPSDSAPVVAFPSV